MQLTNLILWKLQLTVSTNLLRRFHTFQHIHDHAQRYLRPLCNDQKPLVQL